MIAWISSPSSSVCVSERRFLVAKNPDPDSSLPFLVRLPIGSDGLVLHRSQFVFTRMKGGREGIFWQSAKTTKKARPSVRVPGRRASSSRIS